MSAMTILAGLGMATQVFSTLQQAQNQAGQARQQSLLQQEELDEFLRRQDINLDLLNQDIKSFQQSTIVSAAERGIDVGSSSVMQQMADTSSRAANAISTLIEETQFRANRARFGINALNESANEIEKAGILNAFSQGLSGMYQMSRTTPGTTQESPSRFNPNKPNPQNFSLLGDKGLTFGGDE